MLKPVRADEIPPVKGFQKPSALREFADETSQNLNRIVKVMQRKNEVYLKKEN